MEPVADDRQRIDKWLWHARVVRARSAAAALAACGHVRVNGQRIDAASRAVKPGDVVTVALDRTVRVMKVLGFAERRGGAEAAGRRSATGGSSIIFAGMMMPAERVGPSGANSSHFSEARQGEPRAPAAR